MARALMICPICGHRGYSRTITPGSFLIELALWLFMIIPGLIYSLWRLSARKQGCPACGSSPMIPLNSPRGQQLDRDLGLG